MRYLAGLMAVFAMLAVPMAASAQDVTREEHLALARRSIETVQAEQMSAMMNTMFQSFENPNDLAGLTPEERSAFYEARDEMMARMNQRMMAELEVIYADIFTAEELLAFSEFYESPIGRSILAKNMAAGPRFVEMVQRMMPDMVRDLVNGMCDRMECTPEERQGALREALAEIGLVES